MIAPRNGRSAAGEVLAQERCGLRDDRLAVRGADHVFVVGPGNSYATAAKVVAVCNGGTPCTMASPAGAAGKTYEFSCLDQYNCGSQNPGTTNWAQPPWQLTKACTP